jgi:prophage tail gpP-like protein
MGLPQTAKVEMQFDAGFTIDSWVSFSLRNTFTDPLDEFKFQCKPPRDQIATYNDRMTKGVLVAIFANDAPQANMLISTVGRSATADGGVVYDVTCKSVLQTPYEGAVDPRLALSAQTDVPVTTAVLQAFAPYGFSTIIGDTSASANAIGGAPIGNRTVGIVPVAALKHQDCQAQEGETAYAFASKLFTRLGCCLKVDVTGALMLSAPDYDQEAVYTLSQSFSQSVPPSSNMMLSVSDTSTNDGQFSEVILRGQTNSASSTVAEPDAGVSALSDAQYIALVPVTHRAIAQQFLAARAADRATKKQPVPVPIDPTVSASASALPLRSRYHAIPQASYKPKIIKDKLSRDRQRCQSTAKLALTLPAVNAYQLECEVDGIVSATGRIWQIDTIAHVYSEALGVDDDMWILERVLTQDANGGQKTKLKLIPKGVLVLGDIPT